MRVLGGVAVAAIAASVAGCFIKPAPPSQTGDAGHDASGDGSGSGSGSGAPTVRKVAYAYYDSASYSTGMAQDHWSITTADIQNGELILFIANVDNGSPTVWNLPTSSFHELTQTYFGTDHQTFYAAWKIANNEPTVYTQSYGPGISSADAVITLLAVSGYDPANTTNPVTAIAVPGSTGANPVDLPSPGITAVRPNTLDIFAGGADWLSSGPAVSAFTPPADFTTLYALNDSGGNTFTWTTQFVASTVLTAMGASGAHHGQITSSTSITGIPWTLELAIPPPP